MNQGEKHLCEFQYGISGGFITLLMKAFFKADQYNFICLSKGFPQEAEAVRKYQNVEDYWNYLDAQYKKCC